jgi:hypothetical protein
VPHPLRVLLRRRAPRAAGGDPPLPAALGDALVRGLWEAGFATQAGCYGAAGCLLHALGVTCHTMRGHARRWLINEKGMVASAGSLPGAPAGFATRAGEILGAIGTARDEMTATIARAEALIANVRAAIEA